MRSLASVISAATVVAVAAGPRPGYANDYDDQRPYVAPNAHDEVITGAGTRTTTNLLVIGSIAAAGVALGAIGLGYNLGANTHANDVTQTTPSGLVWNASDQAEVDWAHRDSVRAAVFYSAGGALLVGAVVAFIITDPPGSTIVIHTGRASAQRTVPVVVPTVAPTAGGAVAGATWQW